MNAFQYFCVILVFTALTLFVMHRIHSVYFTECRQCEAEKFHEKPSMSEPVILIAEEGDSSSEEESDDDD